MSRANSRAHALRIADLQPHRCASLWTAATVMMTEATSDESVADPDSCMGPVPLRREETMVCGQAGAVPSCNDEETRTDSCFVERSSEKRAEACDVVRQSDQSAPVRRLLHPGGAALQERRG